MDGPGPDGAYTTKLVLEAGTHEYKFVVEGSHGRSWHADPANLHEVGAYGNSVVWVGAKPGTAGVKTPDGSR